MNSRQIAFEVTLQAEECCQCGMVFGIPKAMQRRNRHTHELFYCPAGHAQHYNAESDEERLRREVKEYEAYTQTLKAQIRHADDQREAAERRERATRGQLTRAKKRAAAGLCQVCNRHFANMDEHMHMEHAAFVQEAADGGSET